MQKETRRNSAAGSAKPNPPRKLTRAEKKQIAEIIRQAKGDGKAHTAQQTIPYIQMYPDGICKVTQRKYSKTVAFEDINYQLAQADDKTAIFENWCDFLNYFDASVSVQLSFINQGTQRGEAEKAVNIPAQEDAFNSIRTEYRDMLKNQLAKGNNGLVKAKYITFAIEADSLGAAKSRLARIETDVLNNFKLLGVAARPMTGYERLKMLHGIFHPEGGQFSFDFSWLAPSGLSTKDFIAPSSFRFGEGRYFRMGRKIGAVSFLEILAPELNDRILSDILDLETGVIVNLHIHSIDQTEAIKTIKRKITDLDKMKIEEQKKAVRSGYDMDIIPSDLATFGSEAKNLLQDLQSRNERMFLLTFLVVNMADTKRKLENDVFAAAGIAQKNNCALTRLDYQQEAGLMSSVPLGENLIPIQRGLTTSSTAIFIPFITQELFQTGAALYYGLNALSNNMILCDRKQLKNPTAVVDLAKRQVGNVGGRPFWSWYGFNSRVEWCACFVSWCYNQAGKSEPRFAGCQSQGVPWFQSRGQWGARGYENIAPGDAIFFDWDGDGSADHVGLVIGTDGERVYTVEGNSGDACKIKSYPVNYSCIKGYGLMNWN